MDERDIAKQQLAAAEADRDALQARLNNTLAALEHIEKELDVRTSLGVSNVSFGLPQRDLINSTFFALTLGRGLSAIRSNDTGQGKTERTETCLAGGLG